MLTRAAGHLAIVMSGFLLLGACGGSDSQGSADDGRTDVVVGFYPLQFVTEQVGGDHVSVQNLTKVGAEPHDLELAPRDVGTVANAGLVVSLHGFQPALDEAVEQNAPERSLDVTDAAHLAEFAETSPHEEADEHGGTGHAEHAEGDHAESGHGGHDHSGADPHFWLDPTRLADVADAVAERLAVDDPAHQGEFEANAASLREKLTALDARYASTLQTCTSKELVTSHAAFGYLAARYGLVQESVSGLDPDQEPSPAQLADLVTFVREHKVSTIYSETLVSPAVARTLADESGASVAVLDPLEGLTSDDVDADYFSVMDANLATLTTGQGCG